MTAFAFSTVASILSEAGVTKRLGDVLVERFPGARRPFIVTDAGFLRTGLLELPLLSLQQAGMAPAVFSGVVADPPEAVVRDAADAARRHDADLVIGFGGSSMDVAKLVAVLAGTRQPLADMYGIGKVAGKRLPLAQIPTTAGTGSEVTNIAIVTTGATSKTGVVASQLYADLAILDAALTLGLPPLVTAATGIDAMVHAIEASTSRHKKNLLSDALAREALSLSRNLIRACEEGGNLVRGTGRHRGAACERKRRGAGRSAHWCNATNRQDHGHRNDPAAGRHPGSRPRSPGRRCHAADQAAGEQPARRHARRRTHDLCGGTMKGAGSRAAAH
ncbi:alcohol dehydrogenase [Massilia yuzhufengensis]|uniref:Alcohol dehydrogenase n=1 Tax=Massilia yuzhufengensis TaxID=1164594 RepID=A0A1I1DBT7_9BURK|nr:alcohol dehydrogenase [Massilia yuzhufengensis]